MTENLESPRQLADAVDASPELEKLPDLRAMIQATPAIRRFYLAAAIRCLDARRSYYDKASGCMVHEPEGTSIMRAVQWLSAYDAGLPIQTSVNLNLGGEKGPTLDEAAANSPALVAALERALDQAKKRKVKAPKQAEPVDADPV